MLRTVYGDDERYKQQYWSQVKGKYFTGDGARRDQKGYYWILGRVDDVLNVSGHRLSTMEVESALVGHPKVAEAAVVGRPHDIKGEGIVAFVTLESSSTPSEEFKRNLPTTSSRRSARLPGRTRFASPTPFPRRVPARSCAASFATSLSAVNRPATRRPSKTSASSPNFARRKSRTPLCRLSLRESVQLSRSERRRSATPSVNMALNESTTVALDAPIVRSVHRWWTFLPAALLLATTFAPRVLRTQRLRHLVSPQGRRTHPAEGRSAEGLVLLQVRR